MSVVSIALLVLLVGLMLFQCLLAAGLPLGKAAWGGQHGAVLPPKFRIASGISALYLLFVLLFVLSHLSVSELYPMSFTTVCLWVMAVYFGMGIVMNALSRSKIVRL